MEYLKDEINLVAATDCEDASAVRLKQFKARRNKYDFPLIRVAELIELFGAEGEFSITAGSLYNLLNQTDVCKEYTGAHVPQKKRKATE